MEGFTSLHASRAAVVAEAVGATVVFGEMAFGIAHERSGINGIAYFLLIGGLMQLHRTILPRKCVTIRNKPA